MSNQIILVDEFDSHIGAIDKMEAHEKGLLHRAFSVFLFNNKGEMLLQQRALGKYHSAGLWTNACCSHPFDNEEIEQAAHRRLREELGIDTKIEKCFDFIYHAVFDNGLIEHEFDHVFIGTYNANLAINAEEVHDYVYKSIDLIEEEIKTTPEKYTIWFKIALPKIKLWLNENNFNFN